MPIVFALFIVVLFLLILFMVTIYYLTAKGVKNLAKAVRGSSLPRSVTKSLQESRHYGRLIMETAQQYPPGPMQDRLNLTLKPVNAWLTSLTRLEQGLHRLYTHCPVASEIRRTVFEIDTLRRQALKGGDSETVMIHDLIKSRQKHLAALKELETFQIQAEFKIRKIASDLAATHAEMLLIVAKGDFNENRLHRLDENLQEHLAGLRDMMAAMDEMGYSRATS